MKPLVFFIALFIAVSLSAADIKVDLKGEQVGKAVRGWNIWRLPRH